MLELPLPSADKIPETLISTLRQPPGTNRRSLPTFCWEFLDFPTMIL